MKKVFQDKLGTDGTLAGMEPLDVNTSIIYPEEN